MDPETEVSYVLEHDSSNVAVLPSRKKRADRSEKKRKEPAKKVLSKKELKRLAKLKELRHKRTIVSVLFYIRVRVFGLSTLIHKSWGLCIGT